MAITPVQYLLRFDDLCPTFDRGRFERFVPLFREFGLRPILAVVPDNCDVELDRAVYDPDFWARLCALEEAGATIALHGYRHLCRSKGKSLLPLHSYSEFAGVALDVQREWIAGGLKMLRGYGLNPRVWVAPRHGFDHNTLTALREQGVRILSDGLSRVPFNRDGITWIPQQVWSPVVKSSGVWTICLHSNTVRDEEVDRLRAFVCTHAARFTSVERVVSELGPGRLSALERVYESMAIWRVRASRTLRKR